MVERLASRIDRGPLRVTHIDIEPHPEPTIPALVSRPEWCWGAEHAVNAAGVAIGNEAIYTTLDPRGRPPALIGMDLVRLVAERCTTAAEGVELIGAMLARYGQGGTGHAGADRPYWSSFLVADPTSAFVVDTSGDEWMAEPVARTRAISNRTAIAVFDERHRHPRQPVERLVDPRLDASRRVLAAEPIDAHQLIAHQRSHVGGDDGWTVCMHVEGVEVTTAALVAELAVDGPPTVWWCLGSPCQAEGYVSEQITGW